MVVCDPFNVVQEGSGLIAGSRARPIAHSDEPIAIQNGKHLHEAIGRSLTLSMAPYKQLLGPEPETVTAFPVTLKRRLVTPISGEP